MVQRSAFAAAAALAASACSELDLPPLRYETDRAVIGTDFERPLCAADLAFVDEQVDAVEAFFGDVEPLQHEIYIYGLYEDVPCNGFGCFHSGEGYITTHWWGVDHELVHSVSRGVDIPSSFWSEGIAEALAARGTHKNTATMVVGDLRANSNLDVDYATAGHFVRFLLETYGPEPVVRALGGDDVNALFERSATELVSMYEAEAPSAYPAGAPCPYPDVPETETGTWIEDVVFSCDSPDATFAHSAHGASVIRRVQLDADGLYELTVTGGDGVEVLGCQTDVLEARPPDFSNGDVRNEAEQSQTALGTFYESGTAHDVQLTAGLYRFVVSSGTNDEASMQLLLRTPE